MGGRCGSLDSGKSIAKAVVNHGPMREEIEWGYLVPYMITGILNEHPRSAIAMRKTENKDKYAEFYEEMSQSLD